MVGWVGGWVGGSFRKYYHFVAPSCKLELARFSAWLRIQDGAECGNIAGVGLSHIYILSIINTRKRADAAKRLQSQRSLLLTQHQGCVWT